MKIEIENTIYCTKYFKDLEEGSLFISKDRYAHEAYIYLKISGIKPCIGSGGYFIETIGNAVCINIAYPHITIFNPKEEVYKCEIVTPMKVRVLK